MNELVDLTRDLVSIPRHRDETDAGDAIETWLREHTDAEVRRDDGLPEEDRGGNVIARKAGDASSDPPSLALVGHHDVVEPDASQVAGDDPEDPEEYVVREEDGRLYGRGTADMTGAVAAAMLAFRDADPAGELVFASFVAEETGCLGSKAAIDAGFAPDYAVVGEGSTGYSGAGVTDVAVAHKGRRGSTITADGEAAHASEPEAGENAIYRACDAVDLVRDVAPPETEVLGNAVRGSIAVTEIDGGSAWNVIPESCEATIDERTVPGVRAPLDGVAELEGVEWAVDQDLPPMACDEPAFADAVLEAAVGAQEGAPERVVKPHATDAGRLATAGTTCVVCGPAEPGEAHTADESVSIEVLERCYRIYRDVAERWS
ncbi:MAG: M20 family metallopeptidase [Haloarculaceae archaeon]